MVISIRRSLVYGLFWVTNYLKIKAWNVQVILGFALWYLIFNSGIEASISGVLIAFAIPINSIPKFEKAIQSL